MALSSRVASLRYLTPSRLGSVRRSRAVHTSRADLSIEKLSAGRHSFPESQEQVEVSTAEWSYVERLMPLTAIPKPTTRPGIQYTFLISLTGEVTPSGWVAPSAKIGDYPYFVPRAASHMVPVYLQHVPVISRFITCVKHIEGDIFALGEELREYLTPRVPRKYINLRVHEPHQVIHIRGNLVAEVKEFLLQKGF